MKARLANLSLALASLFGFLALLEIGVRLSGAAEGCPNRFSESDLWACDPILHFRLRPDLEPNDQPLSRLGFRTQDLGPKRDGVLRILALGDSCTLGYIAHDAGVGYVLQPYPLKLQRFVERRIGPERAEVFNAGIAGYNSYHGVMLLRGKLRDFAPDLITVRFGWNDHFLSAEGEAELYREVEPPALRSLEDLALRTQLYPFVRRLGLELHARRHPLREQRGAAFLRTKTWTPTIPPELYAQNLRRMIELARARGAEIWLLTAPTNPEPGAEAMETLAKRNRLSFDELMRVHADYNEIVRRVGREEGVLVVDLEAVYRDYRGTPIFLPTDVPHPAQGGHNLEAETLYAALLRRGLLTAPAAAKSRAAERSAARPAAGAAPAK